MNMLTTASVLHDAEEALNLGKSMEAYKLLLPLIEKENADALFLYAHFSIRGLESEVEFDARRMRILRNLCECGHSAACYELGVCYEIGDLVEKNPNHASMLYKKAAEAGYAKAKLSYGLDLYYGSNGATKNEALGLMLIQEAVDENVDGADLVLNEVQDGKDISR